jgi:hypothetical protein
MGEEIQADFVMPLAAILKKILSNVQEPSALDALIELFLQLPNDGRGCMFSELNAPAWKCPEIILYRAMKKDRAAMLDDSSSSELKASVAEIKGDHAL